MENKRIIQVDEKVPVKLLIPLSIQHMFAMFGASVLVPFVFGINPAIVWRRQVSLSANGDMIMLWGVSWPSASAAVFWH